MTLHAAADTAGSQLYCVLQYTKDGETTWTDVADTWHIWADDYTPNTIETLNLKFNFRTMYFQGGSTATYKIRLLFRNYSKYSLEWVGSETPIRFAPNYTSGTNVTIYRGTTYPSRITLPMHDLSTGRTDLYL